VASFTLIELLVVAAIIMLLAALLMPALRSALWIDGHDRLVTHPDGITDVKTWAPNRDNSQWAAVYSRIRNRFDALGP
jgi:Tfp pilus assembly major pilin PilA